MSQANPSDKEIDDYCQAWLSNGNKQSEAWLIAYPNSSATGKVSQEKASRMHKMGKIQARIAEFRQVSAEIAEEKHAVTVESLIDELNEAAKFAKEQGQSATIVKAIMGKAKLSGLDIDKVEISGADMSPWSNIGKGD